MPTQTAPIALAAALGGDADLDLDQQPSIVVHPSTRSTADDLLTSAAVKASLGGISEMTLWRWTRNNAFPLPDLVISRRKFWYRATVQKWISAQLRQAGG